MGTINIKQRAFTIVELVVIISVIGILAGISVVGYGAWRTRVSENTLKADLTNVAAAMKSARNFSNQYPSSFPSSFTPSADIVLQMTTASANEFCVNGYHLKSSSTLMSYDSKKGKAQSGHCNGALTGSPIGGTVPEPPLGVNLIATDFSNWTITGSYTYVDSTGELTLGASGVATSPLVRVNSPTTMTIGLDLYAATASSYFTPLGGYYVGSAYFASDGTTPVLNSWGYAANGCANSIPLNTWDLNDTRCYFAGGPNVKYMQFNVTGSNSGYPSPNLKLKSPQLVST